MNLSERLIDAIHGLDITAEQASNILAYLQGGAPLGHKLDGAMMTDEQINQLAAPYDHGSAREWCFTGKNLCAFARALLSASKPAAIDKQEALSDLGYELGCPAGIRTVDWLRHMVRKAQANDAAPLDKGASKPAAELKRAIDLLDTYLGDSDPVLRDGITQEEIEEEYPVMAAMQILTGMLDASPAAPSVAPYSAPFTTDVPQCCGDPSTCNDPCEPDAAPSSVQDERVALAAALEAGRYTHASSNTERHRAFKDGWKQAMAYARAASPSANVAQTERALTGETPGATAALRELLRAKDMPNEQGALARVRGENMQVAWERARTILAAAQATSGGDRE